jgi:hypothetical protein
VFADLEKWAEIRRRVPVDGLSKRAACRAYDVRWDTLTAILEHPEPPAFRATAPGMEACARGKRVRFYRVTEPATQLLEAREER